MAYSKTTKLTNPTRSIRIRIRIRAFFARRRSCKSRGGPNHRLPQGSQQWRIRSCRHQAQGASGACRRSSPPTPTPTQTPTNQFRLHPTGRNLSRGRHVQPHEVSVHRAYCPEPAASGELCHVEVSERTNERKWLQPPTPTTKLTRPPRFCAFFFARRSVRHQYDVDAIILVTEVVLDNCDIFFRPGWQERADALIQSHEQIVEQPSASGGSAGSPGSGLVPPPTQSPSFSSPSSPTSSPHRSSKTNASVNAPNGNLPVSMTHEEVLSIDKLIKGSIGRIFGISKLKQMNNKREDQAQDQEQKQEEILAVEAVVGADSPPKPNVPKTASPPAAPVVNPEHEKVQKTHIYMHFTPKN